MMNSPASSPLQTVRYLLAVPFVLSLALGFNAAQAQETANVAVSAQMGTTPSLCYVDGKLSSMAVAEKMDPKTIKEMHVLSGEQARKVFGDAGADGAIVLVTNANANSPAVQELAAKVARVAPTVPGTESPAPISAIMPPALAYITKTYPDARITNVTKLSYPSTGKTVYKVELATGRRPFYAYFDERGNVVKF